MSGSYTNPSERSFKDLSTAGVRFVSADPDPYFQQRYTDVVKLLQEKMLNQIRLNPRLRNHIGAKRRFLEVSPQAIEFNFLEFSEGYRQRFIDPDFENYCLKFMATFDELLIAFLKEIHFSGQSFTFTFRYGKRVFSKSAVKLVKIEEGD